MRKRAPILVPLTRRQLTVLRSALESSLYWESPERWRSDGFAIDPRDTHDFDLANATSEEREQIDRIKQHDALDRLLHSADTSRPRGR